MSDFAASGCRDIESFVDVYLSIRETGGDMEKVISKTADILTDKISIEKEIKAIISQKQVEAKIITAMPLVILAGLNITSSGYIDPLYETPAGRIIMTVSLIRDNVRIQSDRKDNGYKGVDMKEHIKG